MRDRVLFFAGHLGKRPVAVSWEKQSVPAETAAASRTRGDSSGQLSTRGHQPTSIEQRDRADGDRAAVLETIEHAGERFETGALLQPLHEGVGKYSPCPDREPRVLDDQRPLEE